MSPITESLTATAAQTNTSFSLIYLTTVLGERRAPRASWLCPARLWCGVTKKLQPTLGAGKRRRCRAVQGREMQHKERERAADCALSLCSCPILPLLHLLSAPLIPHSKIDPAKFWPTQCTYYTLGPHTPKNDGLLWPRSCFPEVAHSTWTSTVL